LSDTQELLTGIDQVLSKKVAIDMDQIHTDTESVQKKRKASKEELAEQVDMKKFQSDISSAITVIVRTGKTESFHHSLDAYYQSLAELMHMEDCEDNLMIKFEDETNETMKSVYQCQLQEQREQIEAQQQIVDTLKQKYLQQVSALSPPPAPLQQFDSLVSGSVASSTITSSP
jgi:hypothetical protein